MFDPAITEIIPGGRASLGSFVASAAVSSDTDGLSIWGIGAVALAILGGAAALQQLGSVMTGRRRRAAQDRLLEAFADRFDADEEERRLRSLKGLSEELERQVEIEIPRVARRSFLLEQRAHLERNLVTTYDQLSAVESELDANEDEGLNPAIRRAIEDRIVQGGTLGRSGDLSITRWLLILILIVSLVPFFLDVNYYYRFFSWIADTGQYHPADIVVRASLLTVVIAAMLVGLLRVALVQRFSRRLGTDFELRAGLLVLIVGFLCFAATAWYAKHEDDSARAEQAKDVPFTVLIDDPAAGSTPENEQRPQIQTPNPDFDVEAYYYDNAGVARLLLAGIFLTAFGLAVAVDASRERRRPDRSRSVGRSTEEPEVKSGRT